MMIKISGLEQLTRQLEQAQEAFTEMEGDLGSVSFDPQDPASIETAIQLAEAMIDAKIRQWANNPLVAKVAGEMKERYRDAIIERAAKVRMESDPE
jgi:hypothetical protein